MRVVLDTGIFVSAFMNTEGHPRQALNLWLDKHYDLVTSAWQLGEIKRVSHYDEVRKRIQPHEMGFLINRLRRRATVLDDLPDVSYSPDPDDNPIIATAIAGQAFYLVSGDKQHLVVLKRVEQVEIITVREFVGLFAKTAQ